MCKSFTGPIVEVPDRLCRQPQSTQLLHPFLREVEPAILHSIDPVTSRNRHGPSITCAATIVPYSPYDFLSIVTPSRAVGHIGRFRHSNLELSGRRCRLALIDACLFALHQVYVDAHWLPLLRDCASSQKRHSDSSSRVTDDFGKLASKSSGKHYADHHSRALSRSRKCFKNDIGCHYRRRILRVCRTQRLSQAITSTSRCRNGPTNGLVPYRSSINRTLTTRHNPHCDTTAEPFSHSTSRERQLHQISTLPVLAMSPIMDQLQGAQATA